MTEHDPNRPPYRPIPDADLGYLPLVVAIVAVFFVLWLVMPSNDRNQRVTENVPRSEAPKNTPAPTPNPQK
jgi:hypothetical protein